MKIFKIIIDYLIDIYETIRNQNKENWIVHSLPRNFVIINERSLIDWLNNNIGEYNKDWHVFHYSYNSVYMFKTKESSTLFMLAWLIGDNCG
jgi:hypothetical protein